VGLSAVATNGLILFAAFWLACALLAGWLADFKGRRFLRYAAAGLIGGPVAVIIVLCLLRPRKVREAEEAAQVPGELPPRWKRYIGLK
jgi:MFS family permease